MTSLFALRLFLDSLAAGLLISALAYDWLGNLVHELIGSMMFVLLVAHNLFNRRWYGALRSGWRGDRRAFLTRAVNLLLLSAMLTLLVNSMVVSQSLFSFLPLTSTFGWRQAHSLFANLVLLIVAVHIGLHWTMLMNFARARLSIRSDSQARTYVLRTLALSSSTYGLYSLFAVNIGGKLTMQVPMGIGNIEAAAMPLLPQHVAIMVLGASITHYGLCLSRASHCKHRVPSAFL